MRPLVAIVALTAIAAIVGSTALVITRDYPARLQLDVNGVPGYVYYDRDYELSLDYANTGGSVAEGATLSVDLPADFTLTGAAGLGAGSSLLWLLGDLAPGETGSVTATLRGTLPDDLTGAIYDLPGYKGHTAFVDGLQLRAALTSGTATAGALAVADTGGVPDLAATKTNNTADLGTVGVPFAWRITVENVGTDFSDFDENQVVLRDNLASGASYDQPVLENLVGISADALSCSIDSFVLECTANGTLIFDDSFDVVFEVTPNQPGDLVNPTDGVCAVDPDAHVTEVNDNNNTCSDTVTVEPVPFSLTISKACDPADFPVQPFTIRVDGPDGLTDSPNIGCTGGVAPVDPTPGEYTITEIETGGADSTSIDCGDAGSSGTASITLDLSAGGDIECVITNEVAQPASLSVEKVCEPSGSSGNVVFSLTGASDATSDLVPCGGGWDVDGLVAGETYTLAEEPVPGFTPFVQCNGGSFVESASIEIVAGEDTQCTFANVDETLDATPQDDVLVVVHAGTTVVVENTVVNDNINVVENANTNTNSNSNVNTNTQNQTNQQNQNLQSNPAQTQEGGGADVDVSGSGTLNSSQRSHGSPAPIAPPSTGDAGLADPALKSSDQPLLISIAIIVLVASALGLRNLRNSR